MKIGFIASFGIALAAGVGLTAGFVNNASPYVTVKEAAPGQKVHVVGKIVPNTLKQNTLQREVLFTLNDDSGTMPVRYTGPPQSNLASATQVVVIGSRKDGVFEATHMIVKCPSKYASETKPDA